jgi:hypothetical protein
LSIAPKAATPHTMDNKKIESRKRRRIVDDEEDDDSEASNDIDRPIIDVEEDDDDSEDEDDNDDGDYNVHEDDDDEASNDVDDDEVVDKSSNPPGINDSLAFSNKGGEKRSGSIVVNVEQGCNPPPPPSAHQGRSRSRSGSNEATVEWGSKAPLPSQEGKKRSGSNVASVVRGCERPPRRGTNPQQNQRNKRGKKNKEKNRRDTSSSLPHGSLISRNSSSNTVGTFESPPFVPGNVGPETFSKDYTDNEYMCSYCRLEYSAFSNDLQNPSLPFLLCRHRFCRECINNMGGGQDCPITDCEGKNQNHGNFQLDEELIRRIIVKSCSEEDRQSTNNGVITDDVAGSSPRNQKQSLTSG